MVTSERDISKLFQSAEETKEPEEVGINGSIPDWLRGSFILIGPGILESPTFILNDWLDGYGIITKFDIKDGPIVSLQKKFVQSESFKKFMSTGKPAYTEYGTPAQSDGNKSLFSKIVSTLSKDDMSDNCSASLYKMGSHLFGSAATCYFFEIDQKSLTTGERYDAKKHFGQNGYGVHPIEDEHGNIWNMGFTVLPIFKYNIIKIPAKALGANNKCIEKAFESAKTITSISSRWNGAFGLNHSFGMTKNHIIFIEQPYIVKVARVLTAKIKSYAVKDWLDWRPEDKNRFYIIEKDTGKVLNIEILSNEAFFFLHFVNCYQDGNQIIVDISTRKDPSVSDATSLAKLRSNIIDPVEHSKIQRFIIPLYENTRDAPENQNLIENLPANCKASAVRKGNTFILTPDDIVQKGVDRMSINPKFLGKKYTYLYTSGTFLSNKDTNKTSNLNPQDCSGSPFDNSVSKINVDTKEVKRWFSSEFHFPGEPLFIPVKTGGDEGKGHCDKEEDEGIILCSVETINPNEDNFLLILDSKTFQELGRASFKERIPGALHTIFLPASSS